MEVNRPPRIDSITIVQAKTPMTPASWDRIRDPTPTPIAASRAVPTTWPIAYRASVASPMVTWYPRAATKLRPTPRAMTYPARPNTAPAQAPATALAVSTRPRCGAARYVSVAVPWRNSPLETVTPMTVASTRAQIPAVITELRPEAA